MATVFYKGKKRKILGFLRNNYVISADNKVWNSTLYVEGDTKGSHYKYSVLRSTKTMNKEPASVKKLNDEWFKGYKSLKKENPSLNESLWVGNKNDRHKGGK